jgi:hypothetical protein
VRPSDVDECANPDDPATLFNGAETMARTNIVATALATVGAYPTAAQISGDTMIPSLTGTSDPTDRSTLLVPGKTLVVAHNTDSAPHTITVTSVADALNRTFDLVQTMEAGEIWVFGPVMPLGWNQSGNVLFLDVSSALIQIAVLTLP